MLVLIADYLPDAVRGKLKLWFIEPKPMVFVSSVSDDLARRVAEKLYSVCGDETNLLIIQSTSRMPGYFLMQKGEYSKIREICGVQLIVK